MKLLLGLHHMFYFSTYTFVLALPHSRSTNFNSPINDEGSQYDAKDIGGVTSQNSGEETHFGIACWFSYHADLFLRLFLVLKIDLFCRNRFTAHTEQLQTQVSYVIEAKTHCRFDISGKRNSIFFDDIFACLLEYIHLTLSMCLVHFEHVSFCIRKSRELLQHFSSLFIIFLKDFEKNGWFHRKRMAKCCSTGEFIAYSEICCHRL